jgi:serine/threonine-protein kinase RsbW
MNPVLREVTLTLPMAPDMEVAASKTATALAEFMRMSPEKIDEVRLAVVEACINAFEHSHAKDHKVHITFAVIGEREPEKLEIRVADQGVGFRPERVEPPRIAEKLKAARKRGWGLKIIEGLMDEVEIDSNLDGTTVVMRKLR